MTVEVREIRRIPGDVIVHPQHLVAEAQELVDEMGTEKAGRARYEDAHPSRRPMLSYVNPSLPSFTGS